jgi:hypothetical protein
MSSKRHDQLLFTFHTRSGPLSILFPVRGRKTSCPGKCFNAARRQLKPVGQASWLPHATIGSSEPLLSTDYATQLYVRVIILSLLGC